MGGVVGEGVPPGLGLLEMSGAKVVTVVDTVERVLGVSVGGVLYPPGAKQIYDPYSLGK